MNITLPNPLLAAAEKRAVQAGFRSAAEYVAELVRRDLEYSTQDPDFYLRLTLSADGNPASVSPELLANRKSQIEALLIAGLDSGPAEPMTAADWQDIRKEILERR